MGFYSKPKEAPKAIGPQPITPGWYTATIDAVDVKTSSKGQSYINIHWRIVSPEAAGRVVFEMVCTEDDGSKWAEMGQRTMYEICEYGGVDDLETAREMIGIRNSLKLAIEKSEGYDPKNVVKRHGAPSGATAPNIPMPPESDRFQDDEIPF